jgi:hypothetical protein
VAGSKCCPSAGATFPQTLFLVRFAKLTRSRTHAREQPRQLLVGLSVVCISTEASMKKLVLVATIISAVSISFPASPAPLQVNQNPNPFQAFEDTAGNIEFLNISNISDGNVFINNISVVAPSPAAGEIDDEATNVVLIALKPTVQNPVLLTPNTNFNIKFSWDAVDNIKDTLTLASGNRAFSSTSTLGRLLTLSLPKRCSALTTAGAASATGIGALGLLGWRRKRKAQTVA